MSEHLRTAEILLVDDEPEILVEMEQWLADSELPCLTAASGTAALETLHGHPAIRLVVTDIRMPGMDGYQFMDAASTLPGRGDGPRFIVVTGHLTPSDQHRISGYGVTSIMAKPVDMEELETAIRDALASPGLVPGGGTGTLGRSCP